MEHFIKEREKPLGFGLSDVPLFQKNDDHCVYGSRSAQMQHPFPKIACTASNLQVIVISLFVIAKAEYR